MALAPIALYPEAGNCLEPLQMRTRIKRLIGACFIVVFVVCYALIAARVGDGLTAKFPVWALFIYFAIAGLVWVLPVGAVIYWMYRKPRSSERLT